MLATRYAAAGIAFALVLGVSQQPAAAQDAASGEAGVERCIREHAAKVEQAFESLTEASGFLTGSVCAGPAAEAAKQEQAARTQRQRERLQAACAEIDAETDPLTRYNNPLAQQCDSLAYMEVYDEIADYGFYGVASPAMTSLAAILLLEARLARQAQE